VLLFTPAGARLHQGIRHPLSAQGIRHPGMHYVDPARVPL
jgi:hypothetical protein